RRVNGKRAEAARVLGVSLRSLQYKLKRYGIG
ncbi:MAG: helix-turn-helix domain-containing protein, partial [Spirochaetaceae bacterium]